MAGAGDAAIGTSPPCGQAESLRLAATNVAAAIGRPPSGTVLIVHSPAKATFAEALGAELGRRKLAWECQDLGPISPAARQSLGESLAGLAADTGLALLMDPPDAGFLFEHVGRPDRGPRLAAEHLFCDWLMGIEGLVRTHAIDVDELAAFRRSLLASLADARFIRITSRSRTDIAVTPRHWNVSHGEVFTPVVEHAARGTVCIDGCAYSGPPVGPFQLRIAGGRVANLEDLDDADEQQRWARADLTRDEGAAVLCELGLGINPGALWHADLMEAEQARGTCHLGFGHNVAYGGANASATHVDFVLRAPTITVDGRPICENGAYRL